MVPSGDGYGPRAEQLVTALREAPTPFGPVAVSGQAAQLVDTKASLGDRLPLALGLIATATFVLLFLFTGSVVLPVKAVLLNLLSLSATFGAMVWVFQEGHLTWLVGDPIVTGTLDTTMPDPHVLRALRAVDGLRGVPAVAHQGGVGRHG